MSQNVKINGKTYTGITKVILPLAEGTGTATFEEPSEGGETVTALYPMPTAEYDGTLAHKTVTNGNHVSISAGAKSSAFTLNIPQCVPAIVQARSFPSAYKWLPVIPSGATVKFELKNVEKTNITGYAVGFTLPDLTGTGITDFDNKPLGQDGGQINGTVGLSKTYTTSAQLQLSTTYVVFTSSADCTIEFDLEITVNGVRWI